MTTIAVYIGAAIAEIGGCFAFWMWLRLGRAHVCGLWWRLHHGLLVVVMGS